MGDVNCEAAGRASSSIYCDLSACYIHVLLITAQSVSANFH